MALTDAELQVFFGAPGGPGQLPDQAVPLPAELDIRKLFAEDVNDDGADDLVMVTEPAYRQRAMSIAVGGPGGVGRPQHVQVHPGTIEVTDEAFLGFADLDGDGFPDLVAVSPDQTDLVWVRGSASGPTGAPTPFGLR